MVFSSDAGEKALALRLLNASRFHPLLMDRLARLAADAALRPQLLSALEVLEKSKDFAQLPTLFATTPGDMKELAYLDDALSFSLDQLIRDSNPDARRLLWMIALANQPETLDLLRGVWSGESHELEQLRQIKHMLEMQPMLQVKLKAMPPELRARLDALPPEGPTRPEMAPLLHHLVSVGLATEVRTRPGDKNPNLTCHELVRERSCAWMEQHPQDRAELTENAIRLAYAERLEATFAALLHQNMTLALQAGSRALAYCVQAGAWDRLGGFAGSLVTSMDDPRLLEVLIPHLQTAAESAPEGKSRWSSLCYLADALNNGGRPDASLPFYEQAAAQARAVAEAGGDGSREAGANLASITGNWAGALSAVGDLGAARQRRLESAEASKKAGRPTVHVMGSELEALRIDIMEGRVGAALSEVEARLAQMEGWWRRHRSGQTVPEAPDFEFLSRALIGALDIATDAHFAQKDWESALIRTDAILEVKRALRRPAVDIARDRMNRANVLSQLKRFDEARAEMESCLHVFQGDAAATATVLSSLANLFDEQGDIAHAVTLARRALAMREQLPGPADRAISHHNLATYLGRSGTPSALAESRAHYLADLIYCLVAGLGESLKTTLANYAFSFRRAHAAGTVPAVPRVSELLADAAFAPLDQWLRQRQVNGVELQTAVDQFLDQAQQAAAGAP